MINKFAKNIVVIIGICCCFLVLLLNIVYVSKIENNISEIINTNVFGVFNTLIALLLVIGILSVTEKIEKLKLDKKVKIVLVVIFLIIYTLVQVYWVNIRQATPVGDQKEVYSTAVKIYENKWEELKNSKYLEMCPQQITIAFVFSLIFRIFSNTSIKILQYANVISNLFTIIAMILIANILDKQYKINKSRVLILIGTFFALPLLSTFIYGDIISIPMCLFAIYFIMKYGTEKKKKYFVVSAIFMSIGYILRMNNLIFIIALSIYLILDIIKDDNEKNIRQIIEKIVILAIFIIIAMLPATIIRVSLQSKLDLDNNKQIPTECYLYIGMQESYRANGWYSDYATWAWDNVEESKDKYRTAILERVKDFIKNPDYFVKFYVKKIASMWTENTYASIWYNQTFNFDTNTEDEIKLIQAKQVDEMIIEQNNNLIIYQKALVIIIFGASIAVIIKNIKNLSNEVILLITTFLGGFLFHVLWEAKSRYIIPYLIILIPVASISIDNWESEMIKIKDTIKKIIKKFLTKEIILYGIFGVLTTVVNLLVFWILESVLNWNENISNIIAIITCIIFAYITNSAWVFESQAINSKEKFDEFIRFVSGRCLTMIIEFIGCFLLFKTPIPTMVSKLLITIIVIILNFFISKFFAFKKQEQEGE